MKNGVANIQVCLEVGWFLFPFCTLLFLPCSSQPLYTPAPRY